MVSYLFGEPLNCAFVRVPKTGSTSVIQGLLKPLHGPGLDVRDGPVPSEWRVKSFAFVRNPIDRVISCLSMFNDRKHMRKRGSKVELTLQDIVRIARSESGCPTINHIKLHAIPQTSDYFGLDRLDRLFRFEQFEKEWSALADFLSINEPGIIHRNRSKNRVVLKDNDIDLIRDFYREDFEVLGYQ